jgi:hypothetical protein
MWYFIFTLVISSKNKLCMKTFYFNFVQSLLMYKIKWSLWENVKTQLQTEHRDSPPKNAQFKGTFSHEKWDVNQIYALC